MVLVDGEIRDAVEQGAIRIEPFNEDFLGPNSYDVHLGPILATSIYEEFDAAQAAPLGKTLIPEEGKVLQRGTLYFGTTMEKVGSDWFVPCLEGKSSTGRLGISIHATAGIGDIGFYGHWTLEIAVVEPVRIYAGMPIGQFIFHKIGRRPDKNYKQKGGNYRGEDMNPEPSKLHKVFRND
jgi:dCTP deaminase